MSEIKSKTGIARTVANRLAKITLPILRNIPELMRILRETRLFPVDDYLFQRNVIALAVHVTVTKGVRNPIGTFIAKLSKRDWSKITNSDEDKAAILHRDLLGLRRRRSADRGRPISDAKPLDEAIRELIDQKSWLFTHPGSNRDFGRSSVPARKEPDCSSLTLEVPSLPQLIENSHPELT